MTREQAEQRARDLAVEQGDGGEFRFIPRQTAQGTWEVARVRLPASLKRPNLTPTIEANPGAPHSDDARSGHERRVPGAPGGLG